VAAAGVRNVQVHARTAILSPKFSPADNRKVPRLRPHLVQRLARDYPELSVTTNGGVQSIDDVLRELEPGHLAGVMVGRAVVDRPWHWAAADTRIYGAASDPAASRRAVLEEFAAYGDRVLADAHAQNPRWALGLRRQLIKHVLNLFAGEKNGKLFRRELDAVGKAAKYDAAPGPTAFADALREVVKVLPPDVLDAPPGEGWQERRV